MDYLAEELGVRPVLVPWMRRNPGWRDGIALAALIRILRRERPQIVHTHAAKGGTLGRIAALIAFPRKRARPILIHTFHGHSLTGYFSARTAEVFRRIERFLARRTNRLIAVSDEVRDELVALSVAPADRFSVVPLGFDLSAFAVNGAARERAREALRAELGVPSDARVVTLIARLVPIKRVDRFLRIAAALKDVPAVRFLIVGDGELRGPLQRSAEARVLADRLIWAGFRRDMPAVYFASDVVVQTSDNEGTPVSLIEAQAAGVPVVSTRVGGTESVVPDSTREFIADRDDEEKLVAAARSLLTDPSLATKAGDAGRRHALDCFSLSQLEERIHDLYRELLSPAIEGPGGALRRR
jgi:glycosyltransferase involved in cell wall biosynthesis